MTGLNALIGTQLSDAPDSPALEHLFDRLALAPATAQKYARAIRYLVAWSAGQGRAGLASLIPATPEVAKAFVRAHCSETEGNQEEKIEALVAAGYRKSTHPWSGSRVQLHLAAWIALQDALADCYPAQAEIFEAGGGVLTASRFRRFVAREIRHSGLTVQIARPQSPQAINREIVERLIETCDADLEGWRDRALITFLYASGGRRRSEIRHLRGSDITRVDPAFDQLVDGPAYRITLRRTKTGGQVVYLAGIAASYLQTWLLKAAIMDGPVFPRLYRGGNTAEGLGQGLSGDGVAYIVKKRLALAGLDARLFTTHGFRNGFIQDADADGLSLMQVASATTHKNLQSLLDYHRKHFAHQTNPALRLLDPPGKALDVGSDPVS